MGGVLEMIKAIAVNGLGLDQTGHGSHDLLLEYVLARVVHRERNEVVDLAGAFRYRVDLYGVLELEDSSTGGARGPFHLEEEGRTDDGREYEKHGRFGGMPPGFMVGCPVPDVGLECPTRACPQTRPITDSAKRSMFSAGLPWPRAWTGTIRRPTPRSA